jgi:hypothetical protein
MAEFPKIVKTSTDADPPAPIPKPGAFDLNKFRSTAEPTIANVQTLQGPLPIHRLSDAKDFVRLHPDEESYWTCELCFVNVPIKGQKRDTLHLITEDMAAHLPSARVMRFRLALASKPYDVFFLCQVPSRHLDNAWNSTNLRGCEQAKTSWTQATSRKDEGIEEYNISHADEEDAFPEPAWPSQTIGELIDATFAPDRMIETRDHPAMLRLRGGKQSLS